jgi:asparagine synthase (glutamine-hydrolysing)
MCGILGSFNNKPIDRGLFNKQLDAISHRGPDDRGTWFREDGCIGLGSRRLAILDISSNGHMPMISDDENFILVFNGEIYNYLELKNNLINLGFKFKSNSDSECVLNAYIAWGKDFLDRLNGMFSIAIYDKLSNIFFLARDRAGEKPLYYWKHDNGFSFSSELKQLLLNQELPRNLNIIAVKQFLEDGFVKGRESFIENVFKLPPAHYMIFNINDSSCKLFKYWEVPSYEPNNLSNSELIDKLDSLLSDAVKRQMICLVVV